MLRRALTSLVFGILCGVWLPSGTTTEVEAGTQLPQRNFSCERITCADDQGNMITISWCIEDPGSGFTRCTTRFGQGECSMSCSLGTMPADR